jgi:hypothetical protein
MKPRIQIPKQALNGYGHRWPVHRLWFWLAWLALSGCACGQDKHRVASSGSFHPPIHGLTFVAPPRPFPEDPIAPIVAVGANWIAVVPYAFTRKGQPQVHYNAHHKQWWGERPEGIAETVGRARSAGLRVMLKPQVYVPGGWTGALDFPSAPDWEAWEAGYERYILTMAALADSLEVEMFCFATEFGTALSRRPAFWTALIGKIRQRYEGPLVYSANWDEWDRVPFWSQVDYIGVNAYFPLHDAATPAVADLQKAWQPILTRLEAASRRHGKPVLFTEYGYLSVDGCGGRNWELEKNIEARPVNEQAQANCLEALLAACGGQDWWAGGFLWKWFPNLQGHEGYPERDYTPQGKKAEEVLRKRWNGGR